MTRDTISQRIQTWTYGNTPKQRALHQEPYPVSDRVCVKHNHKIFIEQVLSFSVQAQCKAVNKGDNSHW